MTLKVLTEPNPKLRQPSKPVDVSDVKKAETQKLIDDMVESMKEENGIGIAAPQVGVSKRIIIVDYSGRGDEESDPRVYVNPRITSRSTRTVDSEEGCLSVPGIWGILKRHKKVHVKALDREGKKVTLKADGLLSIIFQHEVDHLDGILFIDKVEKITKTPDQKVERELRI